jgi:palmitoyltransferase|tara:strand:- start:1600 stop:2124 length:525 start_codon:yes stop_codon:yes gene_type:complete
MDHHCVWVNNCVGHYNYKSFFLFLFYATISLCQAAYHLGNFAASEIFNPRGSKFDDYKASSLVIGCLVVTCTLTIALAALFVWHVRLVVNNKTTIEHYEGVRSRYNNIPTVVEHPYSLGLLANLREILGRNVLFWFTPGCKISGDGTRYPNVLEMSRERWDRTVRTKERELTVL